MRTAQSLSLLCLLMLARPARAHELDFDQLRLFWDDAQGELSGQISADPHHVARRGLDRGELTRRVLGFVRDNLAIELDGRRCELQLELRELWVPAGATLGDSVLMHCRPASRAPPRSLRVYASPAEHGLLVSIQRVYALGAVSTHSTWITAGSWSPSFSFGERDVGWSDGAVPRGPPPPPTAAAQSDGWPHTLGIYLELGVRHILAGGWDHIAFVAALVLGAAWERSRAWPRLVLLLSTFTLAHSLTLALGALGWVRVPPAATELLIAASIVGMGVANLLHAEPRARVGMVFAFGLLHGLGFASGLLDLGFRSLVPALLGFNLGVELGQVVVAAALIAALALAHRLARSNTAFVRAGSLAVVLLGLYWTFERARAWW
jgi:hypothetical protein